MNGATWFVRFSPFDLYPSRLDPIPSPSHLMPYTIADQYYPVIPYQSAGAIHVAVSRATKHPVDAIVRLISQPQETHSMHSPGGRGVHKRVAQDGETL